MLRITATPSDLSRFLRGSQAGPRRFPGGSQEVPRRFPKGSIEVAHTEIQAKLNITKKKNCVRIVHTGNLLMLDLVPKDKWVNLLNPGP